jgi:asparagine synthase (glutamine-hydrolysing)
MCGIAGVFEYATAEGHVSEDLIVSMRETLHHRGPDGEGLFVSPDRRVGLGHRRLAIVDPARGLQPMFGHRGECLIFNGEIYNYPSLRHKLEADGVRFTTHCDTEVVLRLYERFGRRAVEYLTGMFAFALWDPGIGGLLLARDPIGEKPLYWADQGGRLLFGSEPKAILAHPAVHATVNQAVIPAYLANLVVPSPETLFQNIQKLSPGTVAWCDRDGVRLNRYWSINALRHLRQPSSLEAAAGDVRLLLDQSVHDRLMADVPVGVLLSGGVDSTTLVALMRERAAGLATFSVGFDDQPELDERYEARWVAKQFGTNHHEVTVSQTDALAFLPRLVHHQDEPLADPVCLPLHFVCELAARHDTKVVLAGEGADELFWGYPRYRQVLSQWRRLELLLGLPQSVRKILPRLLPPGRHEHVRDILHGVSKGRLAPLHYPLAMASAETRALLPVGSATPSWRPYEPEQAGDEDALTRLMFDTQEYEFALRLPELLLMRIDRFSMANGVEARVPFLDPALIELVYGMPLTAKLHHGVTKRVLREAIWDIVPPRVLGRPKRGFGAPIGAWLDQQMGDLLLSFIDEDAVRCYFDADHLRATVASHRAGSRRAFILWPVLNFVLWHKYWIEGEPLEERMDVVTPQAST